MHTIVFALGLLAASCGGDEAPPKFHDYSELTERLRELSTVYAHIAHLDTIGASTEGQQLWVIVLGKNASSHVPLRPNVKLVGSIHGDEAVSKEVLLRFAEHLLSNYGNDSTITTLLDTTLIHVLPLLNPDGAQLSVEGQCVSTDARDNANGKDLDSSFPDIFHSHYSPNIQAETKAIMSWLEKKQFVLSASIHAGAVLTVIPYNNHDGPSGSIGISFSPDNDVFYYLAKEYTSAHPVMRDEDYQNNICDNEYEENTLRNGIIVGADWYAVNGTMQDYNYVRGSCMELNIEIACCKHPNSSELHQLWTENKSALLSFVKLAHIGVRGVVQNSDGSAASGLAVVVDDRMQVNVTADGEFWKLLLPGSAYMLKVVKGNFVIWEQQFSVDNGNVTELIVRIDTNFSIYPFTQNLLGRWPSTGSVTAAAVHTSTAANLIVWLFPTAFAVMATRC